MLSHMVGEELHFDFALDPHTSSLSFTNLHRDTWEIVVGGSVIDDYFGWRLKLQRSGMFSVNIEALEVDDSGVYELKDHNNNLALQVHLEVAGELSSTCCLVKRPHKCLTMFPSFCIFVFNIHLPTFLVIMFTKIP